MANVAMEASHVTSAAGVLSLLFEPEKSLQIHALKRLNEVVDQFWPEIADSVHEIEALLEDSTFSHRNLAALLISKVCFHLEEYDEALLYALEAGSLLDISERTPYVDTITAKCIDEYIKVRTAIYDEETKAAYSEEPRASSNDKTVLDSRLEKMVDSMLDMCAKNGDEKQALGIAFDAKNLDKIRSIIQGSDNSIQLLEHVLENANSLLLGKRFKAEVLKLLSEIYRSFSPEVLQTLYPSFCKVLFYLNDSEGVGKVLAELLQDPMAKYNHAVAFQIAFDLVDFEDNSFLKAVLSNPLFRLPSSNPRNATSEAKAADESKPAEQRDVLSSVAANTGAESSLVQATEGGELLPSQTEERPDSTTSGVPGSGIDADLLWRLHYVLSREASIECSLLFMRRDNHADLDLLDVYKNSIDMRNSITHHGVVIAHGLIQAGTTSDTFLRNNMSWFGKACNWAKFSATASLGVVYKGHIKQSKSVLSAYLPSSEVTRQSPYLEGGALYALGLVHANQHYSDMRQYILEQLRKASRDEVLQHGACLGLGILCLGEHDEGLFDELKGILFNDAAVAGEAAAYAIGLVMLGSASKTAVSELSAYAHDTEHEKIIRACGIALAMIMYTREEEAEPLIEEMIADKDPLIRYGGMFTIAMAFCGTAQNLAVRRLLHISVSDVSDDVRRAAVIALGFVLCNVPEQVPKILHLLSESYNPHVRYGAAIAVGISSAGSGSDEALSMLLPMSSDRSNFVRQGLVMQQTTEGMNEKVKKVRSNLLRTICSKNEDFIAKFGATIGAGLIDAGGRNIRASFFSRAGNLRPEAAVGFCLFVQLWYWFPLIHAISLTFLPTALIALTDKLEMPIDFAFNCTCPSSMFAYPLPSSKARKLEKKGTFTAVLSKTTKLMAKNTKKLASKFLDEAEGEMKVSAEKPQDDSISVVSELHSIRGVDVSSTSATVGGHSSRLSHAGSTADSMAGESTLAASEMGEAAVTQVDSGPAYNNDFRARRPGDTMQSVLVTIKEAEGAKRTDKALDDVMDATLNNSTPILSQPKLISPCRILPQQEEYVEYISDSRYKLVTPRKKSGFLLIIDTRPEQPQQFLASKSAAGSAVVDENDAELPESFEWSGNTSSSLHERAQKSG